MEHQETPDEGIRHLWRDDLSSPGFGQSEKVEAAVMLAILFYGADGKLLDEKDFTSPSRRIVFNAWRKYGEGWSDHVEWIHSQGIVYARIVDTWQARGQASTPEVSREEFTLYVDILKRLTVKRRMRYVAAQLTGWACDECADAPTFSKEVADWLRKAAERIEAD